MDALLILIAGPAGAWALARILLSARGVVRANQLRSQELKRGLESEERDLAAQQGQAFETLRRADAEARHAAREDYALTGALVAGLGAAAMFAGRAAAYGQWAVGLYTAGTIAIIAGLGLALFGTVLRLLARPILDPPERSRPTS